MDATDLNAFAARAVPDPTLRLNQLLGAPPLAQQTGFDATPTSAAFYEGNSDDTDRVADGLLGTWLLGIIMAGVLVAVLWLVAGRLAERQQWLVTALRARGASRGRLLVALALQALSLAGLALVVGGLLAVPVARAFAAWLLPEPARPVVDTLVGGSFDTSFGLAGGITAALLSLAAVLVMLHALRRARYSDS
jgi:predicted lysophospholipase L1 biosynthesis ABC-type transport system permease subunit